MIIYSGNWYKLEKSYNPIHEKDLFYICDKLGGIIYIFDNFKTAKNKFIDLER